MSYKWTDVQDIGIELFDKFPDLDPLTVRFTDLHRYVTELDGFDAQTLGFATTQLMRGQNRVVAALRDARRWVDAVVG